MDHQGFKHRLQNYTGIQLLFLGSLLGVAILFTSGLGYVSISFGDVFKIIFAKLFSQAPLIESMDRLWPTIVMDVRLPRILTSAIVGGGLAISGVIFQGILLNPLADPYTLGVSAGAAFGASLAILLNISLIGTFSIPLLAFLGAAATLLLVIYLSASSGGLSSNNLILSGIIVAAILSAGISFLKYIADEQVAVIIFWLMGSFASKTWADVLLTLLARAGLVTSPTLKYYRRHAILGVFVVAAVLTPPDPVSQIALALPTLLLYEISIYCVRMVEKRRMAAEAPSAAASS